MSTNTDTIPYQKQGEVIKNNSFIRCSNNLTTVQRKSFAIMLKEALDTIKEQGEKKYYGMPLVEYRRLMGHPDSMPTKYIANELEELMKTILRWNIDSEGYGERATMLSYFSLEKGSGNLKWAFSPFLIDKLLADGYTPLKLSIVLDFNSKYALALYENLQMRKEFKKTSFELAEFRALMGVEKDEHPRMDHFKSRVLHPAIDEINAKSDMRITYKDQKEGAKITGFSFAWELLSSEQLKTRNKRREQIEGYQKALAANFGNKFKIAGKWYTLTKQGFINRGKILGGFDIVDSYEAFKTLEKQGLVTERKGHPQASLF